METGRPRFAPTDQQRREVLLLTGYGIKQDEIARLLDIAPKTLRKAFRRELDTGAIEANARVTQALYVNATKHNNVAAQIWWLKVRANWREPDPNTAIGATHFTFEWAAENPSERSPAPKPTPATIDATAEDAGGDLVVWQGAND